jgi:hypothetical protein
VRRGAGRIEKLLPLLQRAAIFSALYQRAGRRHYCFAAPACDNGSALHILFRFDESGMVNHAESLFKAIGPDLYRVNAFRLAQLPANATQRDVTRRLEKIKMLAKFGEVSDQPRGSLALNPPPDFDTVRVAIERLRDPETRLVDEFFWFWPESLTSEAPDAALADLERGDVAAARKRWLEQLTRAPASAVVPHNLAVLAHLLALDLEARALAAGRALDSFLCRMRDQAWGDAWKYWKNVLEAEAFWDRFRERLRELNEPQLPESLVDEFRRGLPVALLGINAGLAVKWAEMRLPLEAARHRRLLQTSALDSIDIDEALRRALRPVRERIKTLCHSAAQAGTADHWQTALDLFKGIAGLPIRAVDRDNLLEDAGPALYRICWFCQKRASEPGSGAVVALHGRMTRIPTAGGESVHWDRQAIEVPRCWHCSQAHQHWDLQQALGTVPLGTRPESDKTAFPFVAKHLAEGWGLGLTPEDI